MEVEGNFYGNSRSINYSHNNYFQCLTFIHFGTNTKENSAQVFFGRSSTTTDFHSRYLGILLEKMGFLLFSLINLSFVDSVEASRNSRFVN